MEREALAEIYDEHALGLFRVAMRLLCSREDAEDAVHDVFVAFIRAGTVPRLGRAYLFASLRREVARRLALRSDRRTESLELGNEPISVKEDGVNDLSILLERALRTLPNPQLEIVTLKLDGGLTFAEIAELLGISPNTAASRYRYALTALRAEMEIPT